MIRRRMLAAAALLPAMPAMAQTTAADWADLLAPMPDSVTLADTTALFSLARLPAFLRGPEFGLPAVPLPGDFWHAIDDPAALHRVTGLRLPLVRHAVAFGEAPDSVIQLRGAAEMTADMPAILGGRGFARTEEAGGLVFAIGAEDGGIDLRAGRAEDPFGGRMGRSHRVFLQPGRVLVAYGWPTLRTATTALRAPDQRNNLVEVLADALALTERLLGPRAALRQAVGLALPVFAGADARRVLEAIARGEPLPGTSGPADLPVFPAVLAGSADLPTGTAAFLAPLYDDGTDAEAAAAEIARRLRQPGQLGDGDGPTAIAATSGGADGLYAAVATARFARPARADEALSHWMQGIFRSDFAPLELNLSGGNR